MKPANNYWKKLRNNVTTSLQLDGNQDVFAFSSGEHSPSQPNQLSPTREVVAKMSSYEHRNSCLENYAKLKGTNNFLDEDFGPATQSICNAKMGDLQAARHNTRQALNELFHVPYTYSSQTVQSIKYYGTKVYNTVPVNIRSSESFVTL